jgi:peptidoglycan/LPS O-acetylase OafA/YrhL
MIDNSTASARRGQPARASTTRTPRLPSLTGLRFFAALLVFAFHITLSASPIPPNHPINPFADRGLADHLEWLFGKAGYLGVSFFFVLSGFVLTWSHKPTEPRTAFWRRRLVKIFPNHLVMWVLAMVTFAAAITRPLGWLPNIFLLHSFFPQGDVYVSVNPPSWTLCSELLFYLLFPLFIVGLRKIRPQRLWWWAAGMVAGMIGVQVINLLLIPATPKSPITPVSVTQFWFGYIFPVPRLFEFVLGSLLALIVAAGRWLPIRIWHALVLVAAGYLAALLLPFVWGFSVATVVGVGALIGAVAVADIQGSSRFLATPVMRWLGEVSFGFYLCQGVVVFYGRVLTGEHTYPTPVALLVVAVFLAATVLGGWALWSLVEHPMMRRWARSRKGTRPAAPVVVPAEEDPAVPVS